MIVEYINAEQRDDVVRCTFVGYDAKGRRRPVIDLDASDLRSLIEIAKEFRARQRRLAQRYNDRADGIALALEAR